jgi:integrase/recombinase XerD
VAQKRVYSEIQSFEFLALHGQFTQWHAMTGYTDKNPLRYLAEFLCYLENKEVKSLQQLQPGHITNYIEHLLQRPNHNSPGALSAVTVNKHVTTLRMFSRFLQVGGYQAIAINPARFKQSSNRKWLSQEEIQALYKAAGQSPLSQRDTVMLDIFYGCGLRAKEGIALDLQDVLFDKSLIHVGKGKNYTWRYVPITKQVKNNMLQYINGSRKELVKGNEKEQPLLISGKGKRLAKPSIWWRIEYLRKAAGIGHTVGLHALRHSIATHLLQNGMKLEQVKNFLGHKSLESTQIYTHLANETIS